MRRIWHIVKPFLAGIEVLAALLALILVPALSAKSNVTSQVLPLQEAAERHLAAADHGRPAPR